LGAIIKWSNGKGAGGYNGRHVNCCLKRQPRVYPDVYCPTSIARRLL
jgi:hypothetical protein